MSLSKNAIHLLKQRYCHTGEQAIDVYKRVANALSLGDIKFEKHLYKAMYDGIFLPNSPCIRNAGIKKGMLHACVTADTLIHTVEGDFTVEELKQKTNFYVFSHDGNSVRIGKASKIIKTRENEKIYEVLFDSGDKIKVTNDHKIMMRDGAYKEVQELVIGDSIMPFNYFYSKKGKGYRWIFEDTYLNKKPAYQLVHKEFYGEEIDGKEYVIHHKDFNRKNDNPNNLQKVTLEEHHRIHGENNIMKTPEMREHFSKMMIGNTRPLGCKRSKKTRLKMSINNGMKNKEISSKVADKLRGVPKSEEHKKKTSIATKKAMWRPEIRKKFLEGMKKREKNRQSALYNHKVVSVTYIGKEDVYDIECVEKYHNFAANGIFIHNCYVLPIEDNMESITTTLKDMMLIFKMGGGVGINFSKLRPQNSLLSGGGSSSGVISFMKLFDVATEVVRQGGFRRGALMGILNFEHAEIIEFIRSKLSHQLTNFNISVLVSDVFMQKVEKGESIELKNPQDNSTVSVLNAKTIFDVMCFCAWNSGDPGFLFYDRINKDNSLYPKIKIKATNPCGETPLPDYAACCLGSVNISKFVKYGKFDFEDFRKAIELATRALRNNNAVGYYPLPQITRTMKELDPIGVGIMGFADALIKLEIYYDSEECLKFIDEIGKIYKDTTDKLAPKCFYKRIIAPTGSLSILADCSSGIEPVFETSFERHLTIGVIEETRDIYKSKFVRTAHQIAPEWHLKIQAQWQKWVDGSISKTINLPSTASVDDIKNIYMQAWKMGCKGITIFRSGSKEGVLVKKKELIQPETIKPKPKCSDESCTL